MGKRYDYTVSLGPENDDFIRYLKNVAKSMTDLTQKENVISFKADSTDIENALKKITELNPTIGASIEITLDQSQINEEIDFLNSILNSKTELQADQIVKKFKSSFTSEIKSLKLGDILTSEVGDSTKSIANVQKAVDQIFERLSQTDISNSLDLSEITTYIKDLEKAKLLATEIEKQKKLQKVDLSNLSPLVDDKRLEKVYSEIGNTIFMNQATLLGNLQNKSIKAIEEFQDKLRNILKIGDGYEIISSEELDKAEKKLVRLENNLKISSTPIEKLDAIMRQFAGTIDSIEEEINDIEDKSSPKVKELTSELEKAQKSLLAYSDVYFSRTGKSLTSDSNFGSHISDAIEKFPDYKFELVSEEDVKEQKARIDRIKSEMVEASKSTKESAAKIETEPAVEPTKFSKKVTEQAVTPASIPVEGVIENPTEFAQNVSRQLTVPAQIEVEGVVSSTEEFAKEVSSKVGTIPLDVTIGEATSVSDITKETAEATKAAKEEIEGEGLAAKTAAEYKKEFAEANIQVAASAAKTEKAAKKAAKAIEEEGLSSAKREKTVQRELSNSARISRLKGRKSDDKFSFESVLNEAQTSSAYFRYNKETNDYDVSSSLISNYEKLGKVIAESDANLVKLNYQLQNHIDRGTDTAAIINKINAEQEVNNRLVETWIKLENDEDQVVGADENKWLNTLRDETQLKEINNQRDREAIEISKAHSAALEENVRRDQQAAKQREQALQAEQKFRRAIDEEAEKGNKQANTEREKALQEEQKIRRSLAESQAKANEKALAEREKTLQAEQKIRQSIADSQEKANEKALAEREKNLQAEQKIRYAIAKAEKQASDKADAEAKKASKAQSIADAKVEKELQAELSSIYKRQEDIVKERYKLTAQLLSLDKDDIEDKEKIAVIQEKQNALTKEYSDLQMQKNALPDDVEMQEHLLKVIEDETTAYNQLARVQDKASKKKDASEQNGRAAAAYKELTKQAKTYYTLLNKETARTLTKTEEDELSRLKSEWEDAAKGVGKYNTSIEGTAKSLKDATQAKDKFFATGGSAVVAEMNKRFQGYQSKLEGVTKTPFYYKGELLTEETQSLKEIAAIISKLNSEPIDISTKESIDKIFTLETQVKDFFDEIEKGAKEVSTTSIQNNISDYLEKNTKISFKARIELHKYAEELKNGVTADRLKEIIADFQRIQVEEREAGREGRNAFDTISQRLDDMDSKFLAQLLSWQDIIRYIREVASAVVELDTALTEMRKVSDESLSSLQKYQDISFGIADEIGVTGQQLQESTADFMRLGESLEDAAESARVANVLMNVSEFESIDEATDSLIAMAAAYSDLEKMDIVDKLNEIGNNYSISTDGIATALQDSASALVTAYNDIDEAIALITAGNAVTQDPSKVGAGLRTIALRLTGTKEAADALNELGEETDTMITTQSKLRETIMNATKAASADGKGFDILDNNGNYKSTYEIMLGLAELYDEIVKKDKELGTNNLNLLLETIAGKNRSNIAASILQNPDLLKNAFEDSAINSANSALEENEKYLESIQGHIQKFQNAVQELFHYLLETGTINKVIDIATDFVNFLTEIVKTLGSTGSLFATGGLILLLRNAGKIITSFSKKLPEITSAFKLLTEGTGSFKTVLKALFPNLAKFASIIIGLPTPIKLVAGALTLLGVVGYKVWDKMTITVEEAEEALDNYESKYSELKNSFESHKKLVDEVADKYVELAAGVDTLTNKNLTLSDDDYQEYLNITKELAEAYPELISSSDTYGGYVLTIGDNYKYAADQLRDYLSEEEKRYYYEKYQDLNDYTEKNKVILDDYKDQVDLAQYDVDLANDKLKAVAKLKELVEKYEGASETINLTKIFDEAGISYTARNAAFQAFQAYGLDDLLKQDANEEWLLDLTDVNEANKEAIEEYFRNIVVEYGGDLTVANQELAQKTDDYNAEWKTFQQNFSDALQFMLSGDSISDETRQLARDYVGLFTSDIVEEYANAVNALDDKGNIDYKKLVNRIASQLESLTPELQEKFSKLFSLEISPEEKVEIYEELQALFDEQGIKIPLDFVIADEKDVTERLRNKISQFVQADPHSSIPAVRDFRQAQIEEAFSNLFNELGIDTVEEYNKILSIIAECEDWEEALQKVRDEFGQINETTDAFSFNSLTDAVSDVNKKLLPQFQELGTLYDEIFNGDNGFDLSGIGASDLQGVIDTFKNLDAALEINPPTEAIDEFIRVISNSSSTVGQVQESFDALATAYFNAAVEAGNFSEDNAIVLEQMLTEMGIANASEVVDYYEQVAVAKKLAADNGKDLANMTAAEIEQFAQEVGASEETANALYILALKKIFLNENWINEETSVEQVLALAKAAGIATEAVTKLANVQAQISGIKANIANELKSGNPNTTNISDWEAQLAGLEQSAADYAKQIEEDINNVTVDIDFSVPKTSSGGGSSASEAGKEAGEEAADEYVEAFEKELEALEKQRDQGIISEKEFLEKYKNLIDRYFKDIDGYAEEYADRMHDYFDRLTSYYENVFSAIGTILSRRISALENAKSAAVDSINAEKEAAEASYQAQIDYIDDLIDAKEAEIDAVDDEIEKYQDQIDAIDKQIDALEEANQKRQQAINLQKAQYDLERAQQQRTKLIYKGGQLVYENDTSAVRDARENLEDAEFEIQKQKLEDLKKPLEEQIELLEKRKELIQDEIDGLEKQQDAIQKAMEASNKYYDQMIKETEAYWDALIEKLEDTKSKFEEIAELKNLAEAIDTINSYLGETKYTVEDVYNGTPELIDQMLQDYINALMGANSYNEDFANSLATAAQEMGLSFGQISQDADDTKGKLGSLADALTPLTQATFEIGNTADALGDVATNSDKVATSTGTASTNTESLSESLGTIASDAPSAAQGMETAAASIEHEGSAAATAAPQKERLATANEKLGQVSATVATNVEAAAKAIGDEGTNAESAYTSLNNIANLNLASIVTQTNLLADAIGEVAAALGLTEGNPISALQTAISNLATISLGDESSGIIGSFNQLKTAVNGVTSAIGGGGGGGSESGDGTTDKSASMSEGANDGGSGGLISAIGELHGATDTHIGTSAEGGGEEEGGTVISDFNALKEAVMHVAEAVGIPGENGEIAEESLLGVIQTMPKESEEPIHTVEEYFVGLAAAINSCVSAVGDLLDAIGELSGSVGSGGLSFSLSGGGIATGNVHVAEASGNVHAGNAYSSGKLGLKKNETALVGEVGQELVYNPKSGTYRTVGDNGPEITRLQKGDLIFNAEQTKAIIKNGKRDHGRSYADGNAIMPLTSEEMELFKKIGGAVTDIQADVSQMLDPVKAMAQKVTTNNTTNIAPVINITGTSFSVSGVTGEDVTRQISDVFEGMISNAYQRAMKQ